MNLIIEPDWLLRMTAHDEHGIVSVGGLVVDLERNDRLLPPMDLPRSPEPVKFVAE